MPTTEVLAQLQQSKYFIFVIIAVIIILFILISRSSRRKKLQRRIDDATVAINDLKSHPFSVDIAKLDAVARINKSIKQTAENCKVDFDNIQENIKNSVSLLTDATECLQINNYKECESKLSQIEPLLIETKSLTKKLDDVLAAILNQSALQRKHINELKSDFHEIKTVVNSNPGNYTFCWEALDGITNDISHQFSDFEAIMEASKYDEAAEKSEEIKTAINHLNDLVQQLPELINEAKNVVPNAVNELQANYIVALNSGVFLDHLEIPQGINSINETIGNCLYDLKNCKTTSISEKLSNCMAKINSYTGYLSEEKATFKDMIAVKEEIGVSIDNVQSIIENITNNQMELFDRFDLGDLKQQFDEVCTTFEHMDGYSSLCQTIDSHSIPASTLIVSFDELKIDVDDLLKKAQNVTNKLSSAKTEEARVRELVSRFTVVLNESKASIKLSRLPSISKKYDDDIILAEHYIEELNNQLGKEKIDINVVSDTVGKAQKVVLSLFKNINNLIDTTSDLENYIILCNKYRPYYPDLDSALCSAELAYRNGEYTKACKITATALEQIDPALAKELTEKINKKLTLQKES